MAWEVPSRVREALGDEVVMAFVPWLDERYIIKEKAVTRDEYREVLSRLDALEKDISLIKEELIRSRTEAREDQAQLRTEFREDFGELRREVNERFDRVNERFDGVNQRFDGVNQRFDGMNQRFDEMGARFDQMYHQMAVQTRGLIGALAAIGAVVSALLAIAQFTP